LSPLEYEPTPKKRSKSPAGSSGSADELVKNVNGREIYRELEGKRRLFVLDKGGKKTYRNSWSETLKKAYDRSLRIADE
jgi:hypothetical protein